jgi:hypothetical protein
MKRLMLSILATLACTAVPAQDLAVAARDGESGCWRRDYDPAHLAAHPDQQVTAMALAIVYRDRGDGLPYYAYGLEASLRDGWRGMAQSTCHPYGAVLRCSVDCDGGGVDVSRRDNGDVLVDLEAVGYIVLTGGCGAEEGEETFELTPGKDDRQFLLHAADAKLCRGLMPDW